MSEYRLCRRPFLAGRAGGKVPFHEVGNAVLLAVALGEAEPPRLRLAGLQAQFAHHRPHQLPARPARPRPPGLCARAGTHTSHPIHRMTSSRSGRVPRAFSPLLIPARSAIRRTRTVTPPSSCTFSRLTARVHHPIPGKPHTPRR